VLSAGVDTMAAMTLTPLRTLYVSLCLILGAALVLWIFRENLGPWASAWMPNVGTDAAAILVTVAVIDRIVRRAEFVDKQPRLDRALKAIAGQLRTAGFVASALYVFTHSTRPDPLPTTVREALHLLRREVRTEEGPPPLLDKDDEVGALARRFDEVLRLHRSLDSDVLDDELLLAIDVLISDLEVVQIALVEATRKQTQERQNEVRQIAYHLWAEYLLGFMEVFERFFTETLPLTSRDWEILLRTSGRSARS
jgi:hypothetical protein